MTNFMGAKIGDIFTNKLAKASLHHTVISKIDAPLSKNVDFWKSRTI